MSEETIGHVLMQLLREKPHLSDEKIIEEAIARFPTHRALADAVERLLWDELTRRRRDITRSIEQRVFDRLKAKGVDLSEIVEPTESLAGEVFWVPGPPPYKVLWGQATVVEHESRIGWLRDRMASIDVTAGRHERAVQMCRTAGVERLDDIPEWESLLEAA